MLYSWTCSRSTGRKVASSDERMEIIQSYSNDNWAKIFHNSSGGGGGLIYGGGLIVGVLRYLQTVNKWLLNG